MIDWIWPAALWCWKWPPYQLIYNRCPKMSYVSIPIPMLQTKLWNSLVGTFEYAMYSYISCTVKVLQLRLQHVFYKRIQYIQGRGGGQVVSVLTFYSDDPSLNPAEAYSFFLLKCVLEKNENKQKEAGVGPFLKIHCFLQQGVDIAFRFQFCKQQTVSGWRMFFNAHMRNYIKQKYARKKIRPSTRSVKLEGK